MYFSIVFKFNIISRYYFYKIRKQSLFKELGMEGGLVVGLAGGALERVQTAD